jgi:glutathione S-transferase
MTLPNGPYTLRATVTSPFARKVRMAIDILGLASSITMVPADTLDEADTLRLQNPLGKLPCLLLADGSVLFDSRVIIEFLSEVARDARLLPAKGPDRYHAMTRAVLADGITDAALLMVYESRFRDADKQSVRWLDHQRGKVMRGLGAFEAALPDPARTDVVSIGLSCALGYLDWRRPLEWRGHFPALVRWLDAFAAHEPAFLRTAAPQ